MRRVRDIVVGMAGHIDHGKTTVVKYLTGVDTDTLPEEKSRGDNKFRIYSDKVWRWK